MASWVSDWFSYANQMQIIVPYPEKSLNDYVESLKIPKASSELPPPKKNPKQFDKIPENSKISHNFVSNPWKSQTILKRPKISQNFVLNPEKSRKNRSKSQEIPKWSSQLQEFTNQFHRIPKNPKTSQKGRPKSQKSWKNRHKSQGIPKVSQNDHLKSQKSPTSFIDSLRIPRYPQGIAQIPKNPRKIPKISS